MLKSNFRLVAAIVVSAILTNGCMSLANSSIATDRLKIVSAGHTGCRPEANDISNVTANADGSGIWNATCKGKVYLCTAAGSGQSESFSCAPEVQ